MANYDIMCFLEYYADRTIVLDPISGKRAPTKQWQNFYQSSQQLTIDADAAGSYFYLAFDAEGFGSVEAGSVNNLQITLAAIGEIVDLSDTAVEFDNLVVASLIVQDAGQASFDASSAQIISRYIGTIESVTMDDTTVNWTINPAIDKIKAQVPSRKISSDLIGRFIGV